VLDLRSATAADPDLPIAHRYVTFRRQLPAHSDDVPLWLPRKARAAARRAVEKHPLSSEFNAGAIADIWHLYSRSMRRLGSPNYPLRFFHELHRALPRACTMQIVRLGERPVAGLMSFHFRDTAMPYFVGHDERLELYGVNQYLYEQSMRHAVQAGCRIYDFGRSRADNAGSADFKRFCGFEPTPLQYQTFVPPGRLAPDLVPSSARWSAARAIWRQLPLPIARRLGGRIARSIPG
jgi:FemAB-related protein (PEP-CTERM system-associated)